MKNLSMKEEQEIQLKILKMVDKVCRAEKIKYYLAFGSLIGAIRENGFIKWDDDIDIWMMKEDYDKFSKCIGNYLDKEYFFQDIYTDKYYPLPSVSRICLNNSTKWADNYDKVKFHKGIYFDIFILNQGSNIKEKNVKAQALCRKLEYLLWAKTGAIKFNIKLKNLLLLGCGRLIPRKLILNIYKKIKDDLAKDNGDYLICFASPYDYMKNIYKKKDFENIIELKFEDTLVCGPKGYDSLLKGIYGDYMTPLKTKPSYVVGKIKE